MVFAVPSAPAPKVKFSPTTTCRAPRTSTSIVLKYSSGLSPASSLVKSMISAASMPSSAHISSRSVVLVNSEGVRSGANTSTGWGSKVTSTLGNFNSPAMDTAVLIRR